MKNEVCEKCNQLKPKFTSIPIRGPMFAHNWGPCCETCAETLPEFYYRYIDYGGTYSPYKGTKEEVEADLTRKLEREGTRGLDECKVFFVAGKYAYHSDHDIRQYGRKINFSASINAGVKL